MKVRHGFVALMLVVPMCVAISQEAEPILRPGALVRWAVEDTVDRVTKETRFTYREARLDTRDGHSLVFGSAGTRREEDGDVARVSIARMVYAEILTGSQRHVWEGAFAGLALGAAVGYLTGESGAANDLRCRDTGLLILCSQTGIREGNRGPRAIAFGAGTAFAGTIAGYLIRSENWTPVGVASIRKWLRLE